MNVGIKGGKKRKITFVTDAKSGDGKMKGAKIGVAPGMSKDSKPNLPEPERVQTSTILPQRSLNAKPGGGGGGAGGRAPAPMGGAPSPMGGGGRPAPPMGGGGPPVGGRPAPPMGGAARGAPPRPGSVSQRGGGGRGRGIPMPRGGRGRGSPY